MIHLLLLGVLPFVIGYLCRSGVQWFRDTSYDAGVNMHMDTWCECPAHRAMRGVE